MPSLHVVAADHLKMCANVEAQAHERVRLGLRRGEHPRELLSDLAHVGEQRFRLSAWLYTAVRPTPARSANLTHRDGFEGLLGHERPERINRRVRVSSRWRQGTRPIIFGMRLF